MFPLLSEHFKLVADPMKQPLSQVTRDLQRQEATDQGEEGRVCGGSTELKINKWARDDHLEKRGMEEIIEELEKKFGDEMGDMRPTPNSALGNLSMALGALNSKTGSGADQTTDYARKSQKLKKYGKSHLSSNPYTDGPYPPKGFPLKHKCEEGEDEVTRWSFPFTEMYRYLSSRVLETEETGDCCQDYSFVSGACSLMRPVTSKGGQLNELSVTTVNSIFNVLFGGDFFWKSMAPHEMHRVPKALKMMGVHLDQAEDVDSLNQKLLKLMFKGTPPSSFLIPIEVTRRGDRYVVSLSKTSMGSVYTRDRGVTSVEGLVEPPLGDIEIDNSSQDASPEVLRHYLAKGGGFASVRHTGQFNFSSKFMSGTAFYTGVKGSYRVYVAFRALRRLDVGTISVPRGAILTNYVNDSMEGIKALELYQFHKWAAGGSGVRIPDIEYEPGTLTVGTTEAIELKVYRLLPNYTSTGSGEALAEESSQGTIGNLGAGLYGERQHIGGEILCGGFKIGTYINGVKVGTLPMAAISSGGLENAGAFTRTFTTGSSIGIWKSYPGLVTTTGVVPMCPNQLESCISYAQRAFDYEIRYADYVYAKWPKEGSKADIVTPEELRDPLFGCSAGPKNRAFRMPSSIAGQKSQPPPPLVAPVRLGEGGVVLKVYPGGTIDEAVAEECGIVHGRESLIPGQLLQPSEFELKVAGACYKHPAVFNEGVKSSNKRFLGRRARSERLRPDITAQLDGELKSVVSIEEKPVPSRGVACQVTTEPVQYFKEESSRAIDRGLRLSQAVASGHLHPGVTARLTDNAKAFCGWLLSVDA